MSVNINVSPTVGNACLNAPVSLTFQDGDGKNYGRTARTQKFVIKTFGDYNRTTPLGTDKNIWVEHSASAWRILKINTKTSEPVAADYNNLTKNVPTSGGQSAGPVAQMNNDHEYWIYGISNGSSINLSGVNSSNTTISNFKYSANNSAWSNGAITGSDPTRTMTPPAAYGLEDVYYFRFKVTVENTGTATSINVFAENTTVSEITYTVSTTVTGQVSWSVATLNLSASTGTSSSVTCTNTKTDACTLVYTNNGYIVNNSPQPTTVAANGGSVQLSIQPTTSNYDVYTDPTYGTFLKSATSSAKSLGSIAAKIGNDVQSTCNISQLAGSITTKVLSVNSGTNSVTVNRMSTALSASNTVSFVSKVYNGSDTLSDSGVDAWVIQTGALPSGLTVSVDNANKEITFTVDNNFSHGSVTFKQQLYNNGAQTWAAGQEVTVTVGVIEIAKPTIGVNTLRALNYDSQNQDYILYGTLTNGIWTIADARAEFVSDLNNNSISMLVRLGEATGVSYPVHTSDITFNNEEMIIEFRVPVGDPEQTGGSVSVGAELLHSGTPTYYVVDSTMVDGVVQVQ